MRLAKYHGLGNDFLVALDEANGRALEEIGPELAVRWCDRRRGVGADGLIRGAAPTAVERAEGVDAVMVLHNADGSRAEISGNGLRCLVLALARLHPERSGELVVRTDAGCRSGRVERSGADGDAWVTVDMGAVEPGPPLPSAVADELAGRVHGTFRVGNPHLVVVVDDIDAVDVAADGRRYEQAVAGGVNVEFVQPDGAPDAIAMRVWERGAGLTAACGSGACAAATLAVREGLVSGPVVGVRMPGGTADVTIHADDRPASAPPVVSLAGPAAFVADVEVPDA